MTLLLTGSREHALLAMLVQEAGAAVQQSGGYLGRTAIQKIAYFLQVRGVPMRYRFDLHYYGPFCDTVSRDLEWLLADKAVVDQSLNPEKYSNYRLGPATDELLALHSQELEPHRKTVKDVVRALHPFDPQRLELVATLHYLYREQTASRRSGPWKEAVVARFREVKGGKFSAEAVSETYDRLVAAGLLKP